jgi:hypothetical protein
MVNIGSPESPKVVVLFSNSNRLRVTDYRCRSFTEKMA